MQRKTDLTAEMVRNSYQGFGSEYETLFSAFDKDIANLVFEICGQRYTIISRQTHSENSFL